MQELYIALLFIAIVLFTINIVTDVIYVYYRNKHTKLIEEQNELLWSMLQDYAEKTKELIKQISNKNGGNKNE